MFRSFNAGTASGPVGVPLLASSVRFLVAFLWLLLHQTNSNQSCNAFPGQQNWDVCDQKYNNAHVLPKQCL